jgi:HSP20 family protein
MDPCEQAREIAMTRTRELMPFNRRLFDAWPSLSRDTTWPRLLDAFDVDELRVEEFRDGDNMVVRVDMPGIDPERDVALTVENGILHIRTERRDTEQEARRDFYRSEIRYGTYERTLPLPTGATTDDIKATYTDGVLELRVPVPPGAAKTNVVPVTRG